ncbi:unnamed protein product, partial [Linum tenue]
MRPYSPFLSSLSQQSSLQIDPSMPSSSKSIPASHLPQHKPRKKKVKPRNSSPMVTAALFFLVPTCWPKCGYFYCIFVHSSFFP